LAYIARGCLCVRSLMSNEFHILVDDSNPYWQIAEELPAGARPFVWANRSDRIALIFTHSQSAAPCQAVALCHFPARSRPLLWLTSDSTAWSVRNLLWNPDDRFIVVDCLDPTLQERFLLKADAGSGALDTLFHESHPFWISDFGNRLAWIENGTKLLFGSAKYGHNHLFAVSLQNKLEFSLTRGQWDVIDYQVSATGDRLFYTANESERSTHHLYVLELRSPQQVKQISYLDGVHAFTLSPRNRWIADIYSSLKQPPGLYLIRPQPQSKLVPVNTSKTVADYRDYTLPNPVYRTASCPAENRDIPYRLWIPSKDLAISRYPVIIYLSGAQTVAQGTNGWYPGTLMNQFLSANGFLVAEVVLRTPEELLRDARGELPGNLITATGTEIEALIRDLSQFEFADVTRLGVWGWGYGAYLTTTLLLNEHIPFRVGVAMAAETDWWPTPTLANPWLRAKLVASGLLPDPIAIRPPQNLFEKKLLLLQGNGPLLAPLLNGAALFRSMAADWNDLDYQYYPWEEAVFKQPETYRDALLKLFHYFDLLL